MSSCDLLATAERQRGELEAAAAWYGRARQLAVQLNDRAQLAATAQNLGILYQTRAEALAQDAQPAAPGWIRLWRQCRKAWESGWQPIIRSTRRVPTVN